MLVSMAKSFVVGECGFVMQIESYFYPRFVFVSLLAYQNIEVVILSTVYAFYNFARVVYVSLTAFRYVYVYGMILVVDSIYLSIHHDLTI